MPQNARKVPQNAKILPQNFKISRQNTKETPQHPTKPPLGSSIPQPRGFHSPTTLPTTTKPVRSMPSLTSYLNSSYIAAANRLEGRNAPVRIVAYVESYDDVFFWNQLLGEVEDEIREETGRRVRFEVMLPGRNSLCRGKKMALNHKLGPNMVACVDADYDYLEQGATPVSQFLCTSPYVLHTMVYAIENFQCYAPTLQRVCVMATVNDHEIFDFTRFMEDYSQVIHRLFVWSVWAYTYGRHKLFPLSDFADTVSLDRFNLSHPDKALLTLRQRCNRRMNLLQRQFPEGKRTYKPLYERLEALGVTPSTTYLYMRGHDLLDHVVGPILDAVCTRLRRERESEIMRLAVHETQKRNELSAYQHSCAPWQEMLRKHDFFRRAPLYRQIVERAQGIVRKTLSAEEGNMDNSGTNAAGTPPTFAENTGFPARKRRYTASGGSKKTEIS